MPLPAPYGTGLTHVRAAELDLDLDVFAGPFDLLMAVVLREEISLAEVSLGEIVVAYIEHLESSGELDLDSATEFLVLIASLLELKSRLLLPTAEEERIELRPEEAADELLARMLEYRRYREAAAHLSGLFADGRRYVYRAAPLPPELRRASLDAAKKAYEPDRLAEALGDLLRIPPEPDTSHIRPTVSLERRLDVLRELLSRRGRFDFDEVFADEDRLTQAVTLFALLEMHKRGEATWSQHDLFGPIEVEVMHD
ncbi:MAG: segregation and condensation protein A [Solirubrobacterales bacterium]